MRIWVLHLLRYIETIRKLRMRIQPAEEMDTCVEKPFGSVGSKGYQLQHHMQLADDKDAYKKILVSVDLGANAISADIYDSEACAISVMRLELTLAFHTPINRWYVWGSCSPQ